MKRFGEDSTRPRARREPTDDGEARTRVHGHTKPTDLVLPEGTGTLTREEYYAARNAEEKRQAATEEENARRRERVNKRHGRW